MPSSPPFDDLVAEGESVPVEGWDFSWFKDRATEQRPSWGYSGMLSERMAAAQSALDVQTGGGEVLATIKRPPPRLVATESWPPNLDIATKNLRPLGAVVLSATDNVCFPFRSESFDLVASRHPTVVMWGEIARVLRPGGAYFSQQVGAGSVRELTDFMMGAQPVNQSRSPQRAVAAARAAGLRVDDVRQESLPILFYDIAAVVHFLRKVLWTVPGFTVERYRHRLGALHDQIATGGPFVAHTERFLIDARKLA